MTDLPPGLYRVCGKYRLRKKIGSGAFSTSTYIQNFNEYTDCSIGDVFSATNIMTGVDIAVKLEPNETSNPKLREEWDVYGALGQAVGIPDAFWCGLEHSYRAMAMTLLGPSLGDLFGRCSQSFTAKTVFMLAIQLVSQSLTV